MMMIGNKDIITVYVGYEEKETVISKVKKKDSKETYNAKVKINEKGYIEMLGFSK